MYQINYIRIKYNKMPINQAKLDKLKQQQGDGSRIGGKGTARRKKKVVHKTATDDRKLQVSTHVGYTY